MRTEEVKKLQVTLNAFTNRYLVDVAPLVVDGEFGPVTRKRIRQVKFWLGFRPKWTGSRVTREFMLRLEHPRDWRYVGATTRRAKLAAVARGAHRRIAQRAAARRHRAKAARAKGVAKFDGVPCAIWLIPYLRWARAHGWQGRLVSGWRDPAYSERLCLNMCGRPSCPGKCAGRSSNHSGSVRPRGAVDVSDYARFAQLMRACPLEPRIFNALGAIDPVHFSASGR